jgi:lysylphosphatidylglycerol synthetase-like protein (DUF2156 family)
MSDEQGGRSKASGYFLFAFIACPPCGLVSVICFTVLADRFVGDGLVGWDFLLLVGVPAGLAVFAGRRAKLTSQQIVGGSIGAAGLAVVEAFVLILVALSHADFVNPTL